MLDVEFDKTYRQDINFLFEKATDVMAETYRDEMEQAAIGNRGSNLKAYKTGTTSRSFYIKQISKFKNRVFNKMSFYSVIEFGSKPHIIRAKVAKALHFVINGTDIFAKFVKHPGTKEKPIMRITTSNINDETVLNKVKDVFNELA